MPTNEMQRKKEDLDPCMEGNSSDTTGEMHANASAVDTISVAARIGSSDENARTNPNAERQQQQQQQSPEYECQCLPGPANALGDGIRRAWAEWRRPEANKAEGHHPSRHLFSPLDGEFESGDDIFHDAICDDVRDDVENNVDDADRAESNGFDSGGGFFIPADDDSSEGEETEDETVQVAEEPVSHLEHCPYILSPTMMRQIRDDGLPSTAKMKRWVRLYSLLRDGDSFGTFLRRVQGHNDTLFVVRTSQDEIVGGFADAAWAKLTDAQDGSTFYGTGKAFLFSVGEVGSPPRKKAAKVRHRPSFLTSSSGDLLAELEKSATDEEGTENNHVLEEETLPSPPPPPPPPPTTPIKSRANVPGSERVILHMWQGINHYNQLCHTTEGKIAMGGGGEDASFGICIQDHFHHGTSGPCDTFGMTKPLTSRSHFDVVDFEVYGFIYAW